MYYIYSFCSMLFISNVLKDIIQMTEVSSTTQVIIYGIFASYCFHYCFNT